MKKYIAMWDNTGLEYLYSHTEYEQQQVWNLLKGTEPPMVPDIGLLRLRAQANPQRHYEIYAFTVEDSVTKESIKEAFENSPQGIVDIIRNIGYQIYSDRSTQKAVIV